MHRRPRINWLWLCVCATRESDAIACALDFFGEYMLTSLPVVVSLIIVDGMGLQPLHTFHEMRKFQIMCFLYFYKQKVAN